MITSEIANFGTILTTSVGAISDRELPESATKPPQVFAITDRSHKSSECGA